MADDVQRVYVASVVEEGGNSLALGCFSSEETAWQVLRTFLKKSDQMLLISSTVVVWDIDVIGEDGVNVLSTMECKDCPVCGRRTFWMDLENFSALCHGNACAAWVEESTLEPGIIDCGWPPVRFLKQAKDIDEAFSELFKLGDKMKAISQVDTLGENEPQEMLEEFEKQVALESND
jgi:hypothetical protein|tara:strand:+ start:1485 stop:2015 length:531 start_codon:yes stop_codon:yes gene_type:complete